MTASWRTIPPPPPPSPSPTPWYKRWWGVALIAVLALGAVSIALDDDEPTPAPVAQEEPETVESEAAPVPEPEPEPEPAPAPTSDWPDENTYALELLTGLEATIQILEVTTDASEAYPSLTNMELATVTTEAQVTLEDVVGNFQGKVPPERYAEAHSYALESWELIDEAFGTFARGMRADDPSLVGEAAHLMEQAHVVMDRVFEELNEIHQ